MRDQPDRPEEWTAPPNTGAAEAGPGGAAGVEPCVSNSIVLIGLMGCGKSSVGKVLAERLGIPFRDSDTEIEAAAARTIPEIFEEFGEPEFRELERRVIARLLTGPPHVLATGGGAFMNAETRALILRDATAVWLKADLETLHARTAGRTHRPLLNSGNPRQTLARLMDERYPVYGEAPVIVKSRSQQTHADMAARIIRALAASGTGVFDEAADGAGETG